jgi:two-component system OmpR family response regulator
MDGEASATDLSVLLVEDDPSSLGAMVECLVRDGFRVTTATSGADALDAVRRARFDAFVIDVFLPDSGGLGVARQLSRVCEQASIPVLFVTALSLAGVRAALSPAPVLFKPFKRRQLLDSIRGVMKRSRGDLGSARPLREAEPGKLA